MVRRRTHGGRLGQPGVGGLAAGGAAGGREQHRLLEMNGVVSQVKSVAEAQPMEVLEDADEVLHRVVDGDRQVRRAPPQGFGGAAQPSNPAAGASDTRLPGPCARK